MQRRPAVPIRRVHHRASRDQDSGDLSVPVARGLVQWRLVEALLRADVGARGEEGRYNFQMAISAREVQGRASVRVDGVDDRVGPGGGDGGADDLGAAEAGGVVQDCAVVFVDVAKDGGEGGDEVESGRGRIRGRGGDYFYQLDVCFSSLVWRRVRERRWFTFFHGRVGIHGCGYENERRIDLHEKPVSNRGILENQRKEVHHV